MLQTKEQKCIHFNKKPYSRFTLKVMQKRRIEKPKVCDAARKVALREVRRFFMLFLLMVVFFYSTKSRRKSRKLKMKTRRRKLNWSPRHGKHNPRVGLRVLHLRILSLVVVVVVYLFVSFIFEVDKALKSFLSNDRFC